MLRYRGQSVGAAELEGIRRLIASDPSLSRRRLSRAVCEAFGWVQPNGELRDAVCRGLLLELARRGAIELPAPRWVASRPALRRRSRPPVDVDRAPLVARLADLGELRIAQVRRTEDEALVDSLLDAHHYLGSTRPVGEHLKFLVRAGEGRPVACFVWSSAPRHLGPRDRHIGWAPAVRRQRLHLVAYNSRFLILPWVAVPHLASHLLGRMTRLLPAQWQAVYGHPVWFAETFVDPTRYRGTCYRAANWTLLGCTTGRGKDAQTRRPTRTIKEVWGLGLHRRFRTLLLGEAR